MIRRVKRLVGVLLAVGSLGAAAPALAQGACNRADLQKAVNGYLAAQTSGEATKLPLAGWTEYTEQFEIGSLFSGVLAKPQKIDFSRSLLDEQGCQTFTEVVITDPAHPYVIGTRLQYTGESPIGPHSVSAIESVVTDKHDWLFNARKTLAYSKAEKWDTIPAGERDTRQAIIAAANAYLDSFNDKTVQVPWGQPCARLEGGLYTAKGAPGVVSAEDSCNVGVPANTKLVDRRYVVDESLGAVAVLLSFGNNALPDVHTFRVEKGKIRYVHTITACKTPDCGFKLSDEVKARLAD